MIDFLNLKSFKNMRRDISELKTILYSLEEIQNKNKLHDFKSDIGNLYFYDSLLSNSVSYNAPKILKYNIKNQKAPYNFNEINFNENDVIIDIGAHVGIVSIYLAKKYPFLKIYAFEPNIKNYNNLIKNIEINEVNNITAKNLAVTKDGRDVKFLSIPKHTACGCIENNMPIEFLRDRKKGLSINVEIIKSTTLDTIFQEYNIDKCKLLKIDCEGSEFEILPEAKVLNIIENIRGELHGRSKRNNALKKYLANYFKKEEMFFEML